MASERREYHRRDIGELHDTCHDYGHERRDSVRHWSRDSKHIELYDYSRSQRGGEHVSCGLYMSALNLEPKEKPKESKTDGTTTLEDVKEEIEKSTDEKEKE
jgi:hypothetical protein